MLSCPDCGSTNLTLREAESSWTVKWFKCDQGHKFFHKTLPGMSAEVGILAIATTAVARLFLDCGDFLDIPDMQG